MALGDSAARNLANTTKSPPQLTAITPRWLVSMLQWTPVESGTFRVNRVKGDVPIEVACGARDERELPSTFVAYEEEPREYPLSVISTVLDVHTRVSDLYSQPFNQIREQLRLTIESVKERQEAELVNNVDYGLLNNAAPSMRVRTRKGPPTPDDLDELITKVWKEPAFFLAHPRATAAFGRECTRRGVPPATVNIFGSPFITWRGLPIVPCDKLWVDGDDSAGTTSILLLRVGEKKQGVVGLFQPGLPGEQTPGLSVRFMGIDRKGIGSHFYEHENSNIHRAAHSLAARASDAYEDARETVRGFLNAPSVGNIVFARGATEAINLVAQSWGRRHLQKDDEIVISWLEHHSNIVPWQLLCAEKGARLRVAPVDNDGQILLDEYEKLLNPRTRIVSFTQVSNALGTITPAAEMVAMAHRYGAKVLVDGAQAVSHMRVDVQALDCDFYVFSGHKVFGPTGIGVLYGKDDVFATMPPWQGGGNMIVDVTFEKTTYAPPPMRFEAGTGNIADAVGLGAALEYLEALGLENVARYEHELLDYGTEALLRIPGLKLIGTAKQKAGVLSFIIDRIPVEEIGQALAAGGIAVRAGHHCAQPALRRFGLEKTVRPSLAVYNTTSDIDVLVDALRRLVFGRNTLRG